MPKTPRELLNEYKNGLKAVKCDPEELKELLGELKMPLFGAGAYQLQKSGDGKLSLPFKSLLKYDPKFGPSESQETGDCYSPDTVVISNYCKKISDVDIGDKIYGSDGKFSTVISKQIKLSHNLILTVTVSNK